VRLCLASGSPRRFRLLSSLGIIPQVIVPNVSEAAAFEEMPEDLVRRLAQDKANVVVDKLDPGEWLIVAADTVVVLEGKIYGKPGSVKAAEVMLGMLSGKTHTVLTGMALVRLPEKKLSLSCTKTSVPFRNLDSAAIREYVRVDNVSDCAGAYRIQGLGVSLLDGGISGSYSNVVGLPLERLFFEAGKLGVDLLKI